MLLLHFILVRGSHIIYTLHSLKWKEFIYITLRYGCQQCAHKTLCMHCVCNVFSWRGADVSVAAASSTLCKFICQHSFLLIKRNRSNAGDGVRHNWNRKWRIRNERNQNSTAADLIRPNAIFPMSHFFFDIPAKFYSFLKLDWWTIMSSQWLRISYWVFNKPNNSCNFAWNAHFICRINHPPIEYINFIFGKQKKKYEIPTFGLHRVCHRLFSNIALLSQARWDVNFSPFFHGNGRKI